MKTETKNLPASKRQLWALFCATRQDYRDKNLTCEQASELLKQANNNKARTRWTEVKVLKVIREARDAGKAAADVKFAELEAAGPKYAVCDDMVGERVVGTLLDACGRANLRISARGKFYLLAKKLSQVSTNRFSCHRGYYGGGTLNVFDSTQRQEVGVHVAAAKAQADCLKQYGIEATVHSYLD